MKFIVEKWDEVIYTYFESERHFKVSEPQRKTRLTKVNGRKLLAEDCITENIPNNSYFVIDIK